MVPQKNSNLTLECGLLWNIIILKSEPLYYAFTLLLKMTIDSRILPQATNNLDQLCDVQMMFGLVSIMLLLNTIHSFIKFAQLHNVYVCDFTTTVQFVSWICFNYIVIIYLHLKGMHLISSIVWWITLMQPFQWDGSQIWTLKLITLLLILGISIYAPSWKTKPLVTYLLSFQRFMQRLLQKSRLLIYLLPIT